jgi:hypothetical protein
MRRLRWEVLVIGAVLGCSEPSGPHLENVILTPDREAYTPGQTISADLFNGTDIEIGLGWCDLRLEQQIGTDWTLVGPPGLPCLDGMWAIGPGRRIEQTLELDPQLAPGAYRLRQEIMPYTSHPTRFVRSAAFRIEAGGP